MVFALSQEEAKKRKHFIASDGLSQKLTHSTVSKAQDSKLNYFLFTENEQEGATFGERFTNAVTKVFNSGYDSVITIGNDSPQLNTKHILEAHDRLQKGQSTIGPSFDGGFYLLAISKEQFCVSTFKSFSWQTNTVFGEVYTHIKSTKTATESIHLLPVFYDLDTVSQVKKILAQLGTSQRNLVAWLQKLVSEANHLLTKEKDFYSLHFWEQFYNKGSPTLLISRMPLI
ncbi:MAG: DUF2064 domain-containing protein [Bacteroidota bacterium]